MSLGKLLLLIVLAGALSATAFPAICHDSPQVTGCYQNGVDYSDAELCNAGTSVASVQ